MLLLSSHLAETLGIDTNDPNCEIELSAGIKKTKIKLAVKESSADVFLFDPATVEETLLARTHQPLSFYFDKKAKHLLAGPFLGIACGIPVIMHQPEVLSLYQEIAETARSQGAVCYFFTPDLINFEKETITAFTYRCRKPPHKEWVLQDFPIANIIYNQTGYISEELRPGYRNFFHNYLPDKKTVRLINPFLGLRNKLEIYRQLITRETVSSFLPETAACDSPDDIFYFLQKYKAAYLKPLVSSLARGVYKISAGSRGYVLEYHPSRAEKVRRDFRDKIELQKALKPVLTAKPYLVQQPLELIRFENRPVDFRAHLIKNGLGRWSILIIKARIGPGGGIVTGPGWGGYRSLAEDALGRIFSPEETTEIMQNIQEAVLMIAREIDEVHARPFGELGFDIAVDVHKKIWMIEVNPKPNWNLPPGADIKKMEKKMAEHLLAYCRYLLNLNAYSSATGLPGWRSDP